MKKFSFYLLGIILVLLVSCMSSSEKTSFSIDFEKYTLENGLDVILHTDHSDPIVSVAIQYHVGSNREKPGRTGFAHLFEHMMFQQSENVGQDQFFKKIQAAGGTLNGGTNSDGTIYFEIVTKKCLGTRTLAGVRSNGLSHQYSHTIGIHKPAECGSE